MIKDDDGGMRDPIDESSRTIFLTFCENIGAELDVMDPKKRAFFSTIALHSNVFSAAASWTPTSFLDLQFIVLGVRNH